MASQAGAEARIRVTFIKFYLQFGEDGCPSDGLEIRYFFEVTLVGNETHLFVGGNSVPVPIDSKSGTW